MPKVKITETVLRDAHQSLIATRMSIDEMLPIMQEMDKIGYYSAEVWGGATFDACIRFLDEDPWERLRIIRKNMPNTKLQMLFRGQNMLGYRHYADDVLEYFVQKTVANGMDIIRIFDALNDIRNLQTAIHAAKKEGAHAQVAMSFTLGDVFTDDYYVNYAKQRALIPSVSRIWLRSLLLSGLLPLQRLSRRTSVSPFSSTHTIHRVLLQCASSRLLKTAASISTQQCLLWLTVLPILLPSLW